MTAALTWLAVACTAIVAAMAVANALIIAVGTI
jgi:hypothetical protein